MNQEVRTQERTPDLLKGFLVKHSNSLQQVAADTITCERMVRLVCAAASREPKLVECEPLTILRSMMQAAELGLEVCSGKNEAYLIPRWNSKAKKLEATFLPGYQGLIKLARESGYIRNIEARVVYAKDVFSVEQGTAPCIRHSPTLEKDRGEIVAFYAVAFMPNGSSQFEVMPKHDVDDLRDRAKDGKDGFSPWKSDYAEMGRKTVVRRLAKYLPKSAKFAQALEIQAKTEAGEYDFEAPSPVRPGELPEIEESAEWTDQDREEAKASYYEMMERLLEGGMSEPEAKALMTERWEGIGDPEISPRKWNNRFLTFRERHLPKII